eukprot:4200931-Amphidinium_carterae.1
MKFYHSKTKSSPSACDQVKSRIASRQFKCFGCEVRPGAVSRLLSYSTECRQLQLCKLISVLCSLEQTSRCKQKLVCHGGHTFHDQGRCGIDHGSSIFVGSNTLVQIQQSLNSGLVRGTKVHWCASCAGHTGYTAGELATLSLGSDSAGCRDCESLGFQLCGCSRTFGTVRSPTTALWVVC